MGGFIKGEGMGGFKKGEVVERLMKWEGMV